MLRDRKRISAYINLSFIKVEIILKHNRAILCDFDATLCLLNGRDPFDFKSAENDLLNEPVANLITMSKDVGNKILLVTAIA